MLKRRLITIPLLLITTLLVTALFPLLLLAALALRWHFKGAVPTLLFMLGYLWFEIAGLVAAPLVTLRSRAPAASMAANFALQCWWASRLKALAERVFRLTFTLHNQKALEGGPALILPRHTSIADTVLPLTFFAKPYRTHLRYVIKRELQLDPCLDIYGNRLPNYFVDRSGQDTEQAIAGIRTLTSTLTKAEGLLMYPEGTRYSAAKHAALRRTGDANPELVRQLNRWPDLMPPRLGGTLAMLEANPGKDLLFMAHVGFEGSSNFQTLANGSWRGAKIQLAFWRIPFGQIPKGREELKRFLFKQWDHMQATIDHLKRLAQS